MLGYHVALLSTLDRRLELLAELGVEETLVVEFTVELAALAPEEFARSTCSRRSGPSSSSPASRFASGEDGAGISRLLDDARHRERMPVRTSPVCRRRRSAGWSRPVTSERPRRFSAARWRSRESSWQAKRATGRSVLTANLRIDPSLLVPAYGIYAGSVRDHRAAVSIGINPHYSGAERRIEAFVPECEDDLYGERLVVELWDRLRDEEVFSDDRELVAQIERDVAATRAASRP